MQSPLAHLILLLFAAAYLLVILEHRLALKKSVPVTLAAALIWGALAYASQDDPVALQRVRTAFDHVFGDFAQLFFFLIAAMTYVSAMSERNVFEALRAELTRRDLGFRQLFWITGIAAFFLSAVLDNLTTALIMSAVILAVGHGNARFVSLAFVNLVVAANAGGAFCAFGDITTLMAWQAGKGGFFDFFALFLPSAVNFLVPALLLHFAVPDLRPPRGRDDADLRTGAVGICLLFGVTIAITVVCQHRFGLPAVFGMMTGLALLKVYARLIVRRERRHRAEGEQFDVFRLIANAEWDTLLFFFGVLLCVGGLSAAGWLELAAARLYGDHGATTANVVLGLLSALVDNIPIMYAVLAMNPPMSPGDWLTITLTAGVGGSLLSIGSAAGVALMGASRGQYTFASHLRWSWAVAAGYAASIACHLWWNAHLFRTP
jgi:Na+/H+ antiporter NhaD/arsenite permease-like protein